MTAPTSARVAVERVRALTAEDETVALLDVRTPAEYESLHIPGSVNVPLDQIDGQIDALAGHPGTVVVVCRSGARAAQAQAKLLAAGATDIVVLDGGVMAWDGAGHPVNRGAQRWDLERQVRLVAGGLVLAFTVVSVFFPTARFLAGAVGAGLTFAALTNTCAMGNLLAKLPYNRGGASCDVAGNVAVLTARR